MNEAVARQMRTKSQVDGRSTIGIQERKLMNIQSEPLAKFIDRVIFPPLEGASLSPSVKPEPA
jgi:hypothetical protein